MQPFSFFFCWLFVVGGGDFGSGSGSKLNCAARVGSGQTISGTGFSFEPVQTSKRWSWASFERCRGTVRSPGPASSLSLPEGATSLPPGLITSLHTPVHPLITSRHTPVHLLITLSCSQCVDYLCTSAPSLCLPRLHLPALTCACLYFTVFII